MEVIGDPEASNNQMHFHVTILVKIDVIVHCVQLKVNTSPKEVPTAKIMSSGQSSCGQSQQPHVQF